MAMVEPKFALLRIKEPNAETHANLRSDWQRIKRTCETHAENNPAIETLGPCALLLPVPSTFPILCQIVADAQQNGHPYRVRLLGQPVLEYDQSR